MEEEDILNEGQSDPQNILDSAEGVIDIGNQNGIISNAKQDAKIETADEGLLIEPDYDAFITGGDFGKIQRGTTLPIDRSKYAPYMDEVRLEEGIEGLNKIRARNQPLGERIYRFADQMIMGEIIGGTISGFGAIFETPASVIDELIGGNADFKNMLTEFGDSITEAAKKRSPQYRLNPGMAWDVGDPGWWFDNAVSVASTLSLAIPAWGTVKMTSSIGRMLGMAGKLSKRSQQLLKTAGMASVMRNAENLKESLQVSEQVYKDSTETFKDNGEFQNWLESEAGQEYVAEKTDKGVTPNADDAAQWVAARAGWRTYAVNSANIVFDLLQASAFMKTNYFTRTNMVKSKAIVDKLAKEAGTFVEPGRWQKLANLAPSRVAVASVLGEGVEEAVNFIGSEAGNAYASSLLQGNDEGIFKSTIKATAESIDDPFLYESAFWGVVGGAVFEGAGRGYQALTTKEGRSTDAMKIAEIDNRKATIQKFSGDVSNILTKYDNKEITFEQAQNAVKVAKESLAFDIGYNAAVAGNVDLVLEAIDSGELLKHVDLKSTNAEEVGADLANFKDDILTVERHYNKAVNKYTQPDINPASRQGLIKAYTHNAANVVNRQRSANKYYADVQNGLDNNPAYAEAIEKNEQPLANLKLTVLEKLAEFDQFEEHAGKEIEKEKKIAGTSKGKLDNIATQDVINDLTNYYIHEFLKRDSQAYISKATNTEFVESFDKAVEQVIKQSKDNADKVAFDKYTNDVEKTLEGRSLKEQQEVLEKAMKRQKNADRKKYLNKRLGEVKNQIRDEEATKEVPVEGRTSGAPPTEPISVEPTRMQKIAAEMEISEADLAAHEKSVTTIVNSDNNDNKEAYLKLLREELQATDKKNTNARGYLQQAIDHLESNTIKNRKTSQKVGDEYIRIGEEVEHGGSLYKVVDMGQTYKGDTIVFLKKGKAVVIVPIDKVTKVDSGKKVKTPKEVLSSMKLVENWTWFENNFIEAFTPTELAFVNSLFAQMKVPRITFQKGRGFDGYFNTTRTSTREYVITVNADRVNDIKNVKDDFLHEFAHIFVMEYENVILPYYKQLSGGRFSFIEVLADIFNDVKKHDINDPELRVKVYSTEKGYHEMLSYMLNDNDYFNYVVDSGKFNYILKALEISPYLAEIFKERYQALRGEKVYNTLATDNAIVLAKQYDININEIEGTGKDEKVTVNDVKKFIKERDVKLPNEVQADGVVSSTENVDGNNIYVPFIVDGVIDGVVDAGKYNERLEQRFGEKAIKVTQEELEDKVRKILTYELNTGSTVTIRKVANVKEVVAGDTVIGYINSLENLVQMLGFVERIDKMNVEELNTLVEEVDFGKRTYITWKIATLSEDKKYSKAPMPFSHAKTMLESQIRTVRQIEAQFALSGASEVTTKVIRKTSGSFVKGEPIDVIDFQSDISEVFFVPPNSPNVVLRSSKDAKRKFVRNVNATQYYNSDMIYQQGQIYIMVRGANTNPGDLQSFIPVPATVGNIPEGEIDSIIDKIARLVQLSQEGRNMLNDPDVIAIKEELQYAINVERSDKSSVNYMNVTSDEIRFSYYNEKSGKNEHVHIAYKSKFDSKPTLYITEEKFAKNKNFTIDGKKKKFISAKDKDNFRRILRETLGRKRMNVNYKMLESSDEYRDGKTYFDWLMSQKGLVTIDVVPVKTPDGETLKDNKGNNVPSVNSRYSVGNTESNLVITLDTSFGKPQRIEVTTPEKVAKVEVKDNMDLIPKTPKTGEQTTLFRKVKQGDVLKERIDPEAAQKWWNTTFGENIPLDMRLTGMIHKNGELAWGVFENAMATISRTAVIGTEYHEAFHVVFWMYLTPKQRDMLIEEAKDKYGDVGRVTLEEAIADEFMDYMLSDGATKPQRKNAETFFGKLLELIKRLFRGYTTSYAEKIFKNIADARYNYKPDARTAAYAKGVVRTKLVEGLNRVQQAEMVSVVSKLVIDAVEDFGTSVSVNELYEDTNIRAAIKKNLEKYTEYVDSVGKGDNLRFVLENFDTFYQYAIDNIKRQFNIGEDDTIDSDAYMEKQWDDTKQFSTSQSDSTTVRIKKLIMTTPSSTAGNYLGLATFVDFNKIYPYVQRMMLNASTVKEMIARLEAFSEFEPALSNIAQKLKTNENLAYAWFSNFKKQFIARDYVKASSEGFGVDRSNKNTSHFAISNEWINNLYSAQETGVDVTELESKFNRLTAEFMLQENINKQLLNDILDTIGVKISDRQMELLFGTLFVGNGKRYGSNNDLYSEVFEPLIAGTLADLKTAAEEFVVNSYGRYNNLAELVSAITLDKVESSSFNVNGDNVFNIQVPTFLSNLFDIFDAAVGPNTILIEEAQRELLERLKEYASDPAIKNSNWLWTTEDSQGFLLSKKDASELTIADLNLDYIKKFRLSLLDGIKDLDENESQTYADMVDTNWMLTQVSFYLAGNTTAKIPILIPSDSGNIYFVESTRFTGVDKEGKLIEDSPLYRAMRNTVQQEIDTMVSARDLLFKEVNGEYVPKEHKLGASNDDANFVDYTKLQKGFHYTKLDENNLPILMIDSKPTGRAFQFQRIRSLNTMNISLDSGEYEVMRNGIYRGDKLNTISTASMEMLIRDAIMEFANNESAENAERLKNIRKVIKTIETEKSYSTLRQLAGEMALNHYISNAEQFNFFTGLEAEFKNDKDTNKRAKQVVSPGLNGADTGIFNGAVVKDIELSSNIFAEMANGIAQKLRESTGIKDQISVDNIRNQTPTNTIEQMTLYIVGSYLSTNIADGQGYMTLKRAEQILRSVGRWDASYERLFRNLKEVKYKPTAEDLYKVLQPFKGFYYTRRYDPYTGKMVSNQIKYSSVPLIPSLIYGTDLEKVYRWMKDNKLDEMFFESAEKVGTKHVIPIADKNGKINDESLRQYSIKNGYQFREYFANEWRLQLEIPDHIKDSKNKLGLQISKIMTANVNPSTIYNIGDVTMSGAELLEHYQDVLVANIEESFANLVETLDIDDDMTIKNIDGLREILERQVENRNISENYKDAIATYVDINDNVKFNLPLFASNMSNKWESILSSLFTNNVTTQKIDGGSAVVFSTAFITDQLGMETTGELEEMTLEELLESERQKNIDKVGINWLDKKIGDYGLKMMEIRKDGKLVQKAECLLPAWSKKFFTMKNGKYVLDDINNIPEEIRTLLWYRIPYEGKHMTIICECVGFLPTDANIIVLPREAITQSGEDFDIDKRFGIYKSFEVDETVTGPARYKTVKYEDDLDTHFERWKRTKYARDVKKQYLNDENKSEAFKNVEKQIARFKTQLDNAVAALKTSKKLRKAAQDNVADSIIGDTELTLEGVIDSYAAIMNDANVRMTAINEIRNERELSEEQRRNLTQEFREQLTIRNEAHESINRIYDMFKEQLDVVNEETSMDIEKSKERINRKRELLNKYMEMRNFVIDAKLRAEFDSLPSNQHIGRPARNNRIFDIYTGIVLNPEHYVEVMSPSSFEDGIAAIKEIDELTKSEKNTSTIVKGSPKEYTNYSGGAQGADSYWETIGKTEGIGKQVNYTVQTLDKLSKEQQVEVENAYINAVSVLGRKVLDKNSYAGKLVRRDYLQAKAADAVFAIGYIIDAGEKDTKGYINRSGKQVVSGGTGYAVEMAIQMAKLVYVFDQDKNNWYKWNNGTFEKIDTPVLTKKFAGIGTRELTEAGKVAISEVYKNTFENSAAVAITDKVAAKQDIVPTTLTAQLEFRKQNVAGRALKGMAADVNSFLAVAQATRMYVRDDLGAISSYPKSKYNIEELRAKYGNENVVELNDRVLVRHTRYAWNADGSFTNIDGQITTKHAAQLLAQILDIVKEGIPYNVNTYTFYMYINMINMGMPIRYASLLIRQPIIKHIVDHYFDSKAFGETSTNNEISEIKQLYQKKLFEVLTEAKKVPRNDLTKKLYGRVKGGYFYIRQSDNTTGQPFEEFLAKSLKEIFGYDISKLDEAVAFVDGELRDFIRNEKKFNLDTNYNALTKEEKEDYINWLRAQLVISEKFLKYKEGGEALRDMIVALNTDKRGVGPSLNVNLKLMADIEKATYYHKYKAGSDFIDAEGARVLIDTEKGTKPATVAIYPNFFNRRIDEGVAYPEFANNGLTSIYPSLEAYRLYANERGYQILSPLFLQYSNAFVSFNETLHQLLGKSFNVDLATKANNFLMYYITSELPYFNDVDVESVMGVDKRVSEEYSEDISVANKLKIVQDKYKDVLFNDTHILNYLVPNISGILTRKRGLHTISFINTKTDDITDNTLIDTFELLWSGKINKDSEFDADVKDLAESLVKYNFLTYGFSMGIDSFGKLIPNSVFKKIGYDTFLYDQIDKMKDPRALLSDGIIDKFMRNNSLDTSIVPMVNSAKNTYWTPNAKGVIEISANTVSLGKDKMIGKSLVNVPLYITKDGKKISIGTRLFKLTETDTDVVRYVPIDRLGSKFFKETSERSIIKNNRVLFDEQTYNRLADSTAVNLNGKSLPANQIANSRYELMFRFAERFIGDGIGKYSYTDRIKNTFGDYANVREYNEGQLVMVAAPTKSDANLNQISAHIVDGKFKGVYSNITRAIMDGATVMISSPFDEYGNKLPDYNSQYFLGEYVIRKRLGELVNDGAIAARVENGILYYAKSEDVLTTISRKFNDLDDATNGNIKCNV